jgi:hypothetical protein
VDEPKVRAIHVFALLLMFWCAWLYTEITEHISRSAHEAEVDAFMSRGDRFTREMGAELEARIIKIEKEIDGGGG